MRAGAVCRERWVPRGSREPAGSATPAGPRLHKQLSRTTCLARAGELGWKNLLPMAVRERAGTSSPPAAASKPQHLSCLLGEGQGFPNLTESAFCGDWPLSTSPFPQVGRRSSSDLPE